MILDTSISETYIEDCEICCNPIQIQTQFINNDLQSFEALNIEQ